MKIIKIIFLLLFTNFILGLNNNNYTPNKIDNTMFLTGEDYISSEDGVARMNINIWGHVKYPGTYLVYDSIDILTCLSIAGGPLKGAKLSKVSIISKDGTTRKINLKDKINGKKNLVVLLNPHDTIYIDETTGNYLLARSNVINILLQITNLILLSKNN